MSLNKKNLTVILSIIFVIHVFQAGIVHSRVVKDTTALCVKCHPKTGEFAKKNIVHQPVKDGKCTWCHNPHTSKYPNLLGDAGGSLCFNCHDQKKGFTGAVVHKPVEEGNCLSCHEAHSSNSSGLLKKGGGEGCYSCHAKGNIAGKKIIHPEVKKGNCAVCHNPHASDRDGLLTKDRKSICVGCHKDGGAVFAKAHMGYNVAGSDCLSCHNPHSSDKKGILKVNLHKPFEENRCASCHQAGSTETIRGGTGLCTECHKEVLSGFNRINSHLMAGKDGSPCGNCHNPHASDEKYLLKDKEERVCYKCHGDTKEYVAKGNYKHPKLGACSDCHVSHGSNNNLFLAKGRDTCSMENCHATQGKFTHPVGEKIIDPRSKTPVDCVTCHNPMGSPEKAILRFEKDRELCIQCHQM